MGDELKNVLGLPETSKNGSAKNQNGKAPGDGSHEKRKEFGERFRERIATINEDLRIVAALASDPVRQELNSQRERLLEAYQKTSALIESAEPTKADGAIRRVFDATEVTQNKAKEKADDAAEQHIKWLDTGDDFDEAILRIAELEAADHDKAKRLRALSDAILARANDRKFGESVTAFEQMRAKLDAIYAQYTAEAEDGEEAPREGLAVLVIDALTGETVEGVSVKVGDQTDTSSAAGLATVELPPGKHAYAAESEGYAPIKGEVEVVAGDNVELVIELSPRDLEGFTVWVKDHDSGEDLERAEVLIGGQQGATSPNGLIAFELPPGVHEYEVTLDGYEGVAGAAEVVAGDNPELELEMLPADRAPQPDAGPVAVAILATDKATGAVLAGVQVTIGGQSATTSAIGWASVDLPPGEHEYEASADGYKTLVGSKEVDSENAALPIEMRGDERAMRPVSIEVLDDTGEPVAGAKVQLAARVSFTDASGLARFTAPVGAGNLAISAPSIQPSVWPFEVRADGDNTATYSLLNRDPEPTEMAPSGVTVIVTDLATSEPLAGVAVRALERSYETDGSGVATIEAPQGTHPVFFELAGYTNLTLVAEVEGERPLRYRVGLTPSESSDAAR